MRKLSSSLTALGFLVSLMACDSAPEADLASQTAQTCGDFTPGLIQFSALAADSTPINGFAAVTQDQLCRPRYVQIDDCADSKEAKQWAGYVQTEPKLMDGSNPEEYNAFMQQAVGENQSGDFYRLPHLSCRAGAKIPLEIEAGTFVVGDLGRTSFVAKKEDAGKIVYSFPSTCLKLRSFFDPDRLFLDERVQVLDELPRLNENDTEILLGCGYERPAPTSKDIWRLYRVPAAKMVMYLLRYEAEQAADVVEVLVQRADGQPIYSSDDAEKKKRREKVESELQSIFQRTIEPLNFSLDFENPDRPLLDICIDKCSGFVPLHELRKNKKTVPWQPHPPQGTNLPTVETFRQDSTVQPDGRVMDTLSLPSGRMLAFGLCASSQSNPLASRFGFLPSGKTLPTIDDWLNLVKASIIQKVPSPLMIPCSAPLSDVCRVSIVETDLSATISTAWDGISDLIGKSRLRAECKNSKTLRLELPGEKKVTGYTWTIGNPTGITPYSTIQVVGTSPTAAIVQQLECGNTNSCARNEIPVIKIVGDANIVLQGFSIRTRSSPNVVRTLALLREGTAGSLVKLHLRKVKIGEKDFPFNTGIRLVGGLSFFHDLDLQAYFKGIRAVSSTISVTGSRGTGPLLPTGEAQITVLDIDGKAALPDLGQSYYLGTDGVAIHAVNTRAQVYLTNTRAPRVWSLGVGTRIDADKIDLANSNNLLQDTSQAFTMTENTTLNVESLKVQNYATLLYFTSNAIAQAKVRISNFVSGSYTTSRAAFIINPQAGVINFEAETGTEKGVSCPFDAAYPNRCTF